MNTNWTPWALAPLIALAFAASAPAGTPTRRLHPTIDELIDGQIDKLKNPHFEVRRDAAKTLGMRPKEARRAMPALVEALSDPHPEVREAAATALSRIGGTAAVPGLACALAMLPRASRDAGSAR